MMSLRVILPVEEEGADVDGADQDGIKRKGGVADPNCLDLCLVQFNGNSIYGTHKGKVVGR